MILPRPCRSCNTRESHGYKAKAVTGEDSIVYCADCVRVTPRYVLPSVRAEQQEHAKEIVQPMKMTKKGLEPNPEFDKMYPGKRENFYQATKDAHYVESKRAEKPSEQI